MVTLLNAKAPFVVGVVVERSVTDAEHVAGAAFTAGAHSVELNLASLKTPSQIDEGFFVRLQSPVYTTYRRAPFMAIYGPRFSRLPACTDEHRMAQQTRMLCVGSAGLDIEADTFAPNRDEWTNDRAALRQQRTVAATAHHYGAAVIYSWHPPRKLTLREALHGARALRNRGADLVKIVERVRTRADALHSVAISLALRDKLDHPFIFLALGKEALRFRPLMTAFGAAYLLARPPVGANRLPAQPPVAHARALVSLV